MQQGRATKRVRPLSGLARSIRIEWPERLDRPTLAQILSLMNIVLAREDTIGFSKPLSVVEGRAVVQVVVSAVEGGKKRIMLLRAADDGLVIGHLLLTPSTLPNCHHIGEVSRVFVHPDFRGISAIRMGMISLLKKCDTLGIEVLKLDVRANTRIHKLWRSLGFLEIGIMEDYARVNGESLPGCYMYQHVSKLKPNMGLEVG